MRYVVLFLVCLSVKAEVLTPQQLMERDHLPCLPIVIDRRTPAIESEKPVQIASAAASFRAFEETSGRIAGRPESEIIENSPAVPRACRPENPNIDAEAGDVIEVFHKNAMRHPDPVPDTLTARQLMERDGLSVPPVVMDMRVIPELPIEAVAIINQIASVESPPRFVKKIPAEPIKIYGDPAPTQDRAPNILRIDTPPAPLYCAECQRQAERPAPPHRHHDKRQY